jgi:serine/threonine protein kinase
MGYCSTNGVVNMLYEIVEDSLVKDIELRSIENNPFPENEIWIVLYLLTKTASSFHDKGLSIGDIRPENIFLAENEKFVKIATEHSWIGEKTLRDKFLAKEKIFLSKAMIECFSTQSIVPLKISFSNDSFAIGMTLAECILL